MKQRTPLQRVLDWVEENKRRTSEGGISLFVEASRLRAFIESIKEEEKENIARAFRNGVEAEAGLAKDSMQNNPPIGENYFNQTFEQ